MQHASASSDEDVLVNLAKPVTSATITVRVIKSFEYRTEKSVVLHDINLEDVTVAQLKDIVKKGTRFARLVPY
jgi:hypothetical protein